MDIRTFYFTSLCCICFFSGLLLWIIWQKAKEDAPQKDNRGILFLALTQFSWFVLGLYSLLGSFSVSNPILSTTINGIMSSLNNIFMLSCLAYFQGFDGLKERFSVLKDRDKWIMTTFVSFTLLLMLFLILDNIKIGNNLIGKYSVIILDLFVSLLTGFISYYGIGSSFKGSKYAKPLFRLSIFVGFMLIATQLGFGYRNWVKIGNPDSINPYRDAMRCLFLIGISWTSFLTLLLGKHWAEEQEIEVSLATNSLEEVKSPNSSQKLQPKQLFIIYQPDNKQYILRLQTYTNESKEAIILERKSEKLFLPFVYWLYFSIAKKKNILIRHNDIQVWKNRMVTYINEKNELPLDVFSVDGGKYELNIAKEEIYIEGLALLKEKQSVKDIFTSYLLDTTGIDLAKYRKDKHYKAEIAEDLYARQFE